MKLAMYRIHKICIMVIFIALFSMCTMHHEDNRSGGIVLSFDDYFPNEWKGVFDLFDRYNARVTFFINGSAPSSFMFYAEERGHEIGFHTITHARLPALTREAFFEETVAPINAFRSQGIELTSFAYPWGDYERWMHNELLKYYRVLRGAGGNFIHERANKRFGFVGSKSIDNFFYDCDIIFQQEIGRILREVKVSGKIVSLFSHNIGTMNWGITQERLEFVLRKGNEYGLTFYRFNDLQ